MAIMKLTFKNRTGSYEIPLNLHFFSVDGEEITHNTFGKANETMSDINAQLCAEEKVRASNINLAKEEREKKEALQEKLDKILHATPEYKKALKERQLKREEYQAVKEECSCGRDYDPRKYSQCFKCSLGAKGYTRYKNNYK